MFSSKKICILATISLALILSCTAQNDPQNYINIHNRARDKVGVGLLKWDAKIATHARNLAHSRKSTCELLPSNGPYGENIAVRGPDNASSLGNATVWSWVAERAFYDASTNTCMPGKVCDHYTQIVWRNSVKLGCSRAPCKDGRSLIVCNYFPPGNVKGQRPY